MARPEPTILVRRVLWGSMGASIAALGVGLPSLLAGGTADQGVLGLPLGLASLGAAGAAVFLARRGNPTLWIVGLSLADVPAVLGLVAHLIGAGTALPFAVLAFLAWALCWPKDAPGPDPVRASLDLPPPAT